MNFTDRKSDDNLPQRLLSWSPARSLLVAALFLFMLGLTGQLVHSFAQSVPALPANSGSITVQGHIGGPVQTLAIMSDTLYASMGPELAALDLSVPDLPARQGYALYRHNLTSLTISGSLAYLTDGNFAIASLANPAAPIPLGSANIPGTALAVAVTGARAVVVGSNFAAPYGHLRVFDVLAPTAPAELGSLSFAAEARAVAITGTHAVVANDISGLRIVAFNNPAQPQLVATFPTNGQAYDVLLRGNYAFVATVNCAVNCAGGLQVVDLTNLSAPTNVHFTSLPSQPTRLARQEDLLLVANGASGVAQFDISDPTAPAGLGLTPLAGKAVAVIPNGDSAYVATGRDGIYHLTLSPTLATAGLPSFADALSAAFYANYAYIGDGNGLFVVDTSLPTAPQIVRQIATAGAVEDVTIAAGYAYLAQEQAGLLIYDLTDPADPQLVASFDTPGAVHAVLVAGAYAYLADGPTGLRVLDVANPAAPVELTAIDTAGIAHGLALDDDTLYLADFDRGLRIFDLSNPASPNELGLYDTPGEARAVAVAAGFAYVADGVDGLRVIDVSQPGTPVEVGSFQNFRYAHDVDLVGYQVYLANDSGGLLIFDVTDPAQPTLIDSKSSAGLAWGVAIDPARRLIGLADRYGGFYLYGHEGLTLGGTVRQANGHGFGGITIVASTGSSVVSDGQGAFSFADPSLGPQRLTATNPSYRFLPASQLVTLPPSQTNVRFVVLPLPVQTVVSNAGGGNLSFAATNGVTTTLTVPPGAVASEITLVLTPTLVTPPAGFAFASHGFQLTAYQNGSALPNFTFNQPVNITLDYGDDDLGSINHETSLALYWSVSTSWALAGDSCSPPAGSQLQIDQNRLQTAFCQTGRFGLFGDPKQLFLPFVARP